MKESPWSESSLIRVVEHEGPLLALFGGDVFECIDVMLDPHIGLMQRPVVFAFRKLSHEINRGYGAFPFRADV